MYEKLENYQNKINIIEKKKIVAIETIQRISKHSDIEKKYFFILAKLCKKIDNYEGEAVQMKNKYNVLKNLLDDLEESEAKIKEEEDTPYYEDEEEQIN